MSDDLVVRLRTSAGIDDVHDAADLIEAQAAEIARLRAACDAYFKTISLSQMRHGRILVGLELRNARQRRALAKLYQRRHDKNAALATARRDALAEIKQDTDELIEQGRQDGMEQAAQWHDQQAARAQKLSDMKVSAEDEEVWGEYAENHREYAAEIRAAAKEGKP